MKKIICMLVCMPICSLVQASQCSIDGFSAPEMRLGNYYRSQSATSFNISCDHGYSIVFNSQNLASPYGKSFVSNGPYKLRTQLNIQGTKENLWGVPLNQQASQNHKFIISVQLEDNPLKGVPAGTYRDRISVNISF